MTNTKKTREQITDIKARLKNRFMSLTATPEDGLTIKDENGEILGVAFPQSELSLKFIQAFLSCAKLDAELAQLEAMLEEHGDRNSRIARPSGPIPIQ